jgi:hypothetical protein
MILSADIPIRSERLKTPATPEANDHPSSEALDLSAHTVRTLRAPRCAQTQKAGPTNVAPDSKRSNCRVEFQQPSLKHDHRV